MKYRYTSLDRILAKLYRDLGITEMSETDVIEWAGEALELIGAVSLYEERVDILTIKDYEVVLPLGLHMIVQVAYNRGDSVSPTYRDDCGIGIAEVWGYLEGTTLPPPPPPPLATTTAEEVTQRNFLEEEDVGDTIEATTEPFIEEEEVVDAADDTMVVPLPSRTIEGVSEVIDTMNHYLWIPQWWGTPIYHQRFVPMRLANGTLFGRLVAEDNSGTPYDGDYQYTVVDDRLRTNIRSGQVALAYHRQKVDAATGYPMVPEEVSIITAITAYVTWKYMQRLWYMGREGYDSKMAKAEEQWQWYCRQARSKAMMPQGVEDHQNLLNINRQMLPKVDRYYGFFGRLGTREPTHWKDSDGRTQYTTYNNNFNLF